MYALLGSYIFLLGLIFGSFALALVDRIKAGKDWVKDRSACEFCGHTLSPLDLFPVLSWVLLGGKCRYCKKKLSLAYPAVELLSGGLFLVSFLFFPYELSGIGVVYFCLWAVALVLCVALFVYDFRWFTLPNILMYPLIGVAGLYRAVYLLQPGKESLINELIKLALAIAVASGLFALLYVISKGKWIGDGDIFLGIAMGLFLPGPIEAWLAIFFASLLGLVAALPSMLQKKTTLHTKLPYGPLLILGLVASFLFSEVIIDWYTTTLLFV